MHMMPVIDGREAANRHRAIRVPIAQPDAGNPFRWAPGGAFIHVGHGVGRRVRHGLRRLGVAGRIHAKAAGENHHHKAKRHKTRISQPKPYHDAREYSGFQDCPPRHGPSQGQTAHFLVS